MMRSARTTVILAGAVLLALCLAGHSAGKKSPAPVKRLEQFEDPHRESVVLVEAFMVRVRLSALYDLGVPVISQGSKSVSVDHILKCLNETDAAEVTAGAKLAVGQAGQAETNSIIHQGHYGGPPEKRRLEYVDVGTSLMAATEIQRRGKILLEFDFKHSGQEENRADDDVGLAIAERNWSGKILLEDGKPTLVGATQDHETGVFLIVTAGIKK